MSQGCVGALARSLREIARGCVHSDAELVELATLLASCHVESWRDLVRASSSDFVGLVSGSSIESLCAQLCRSADLAAAQPHSQCRVAVNGPCPRTRSRSPVTLGLHCDALAVAANVGANRGAIACRRTTELRPLQALRAAEVEVVNGLSPLALCARAHVDAVLGSAPASLPSVASGLRCWAAFCDGVLGLQGRHLPPSVEGLVAFSSLFRNHKTYGNYLSYIVVGCHLAGVDDGAARHPIVKRAKTAIMKRQAAPPPKMFIQLSLLVQLVALALREDDMVSAMYYVATYAFLLRPRAESLPLIKGSAGSTSVTLPPGVHSAVELCSDAVVLRLARRKNRPHGSVLRRHCWCHQSTDTCPVHVLGKWLDGHVAGARPFDALSAGVALPCLRRRLGLLGVAHPYAFKLHDFRRGHAQDMLEKGSKLRVILAAGEWTSSAFTAYLDTCDLESRAVLEAHWVASDDDA